MSSPCPPAVHSIGAVAFRVAGNFVSRPRPSAHARSTAAIASVRDTLTLDASSGLAVKGAVTDAGDDTSSAKKPRSTNTAIAAVSSLASLAALSYAAPSDAAAEALPSIVASFNLATFSPQLFWLMMILAPRSAATRVVMGSWIPVLFAASIHLFVDAVGLTSEGALEEAATFGQVFDPTIPPTMWASGEVLGPLTGFTRTYAGKSNLCHRGVVARTCVGPLRGAVGVARRVAAQRPSPG